MVRILIGDYFLVQISCNLLYEIRGRSRLCPQNLRYKCFFRLKENDCVLRYKTSIGACLGCCHVLPHFFAPGLTFSWQVFGYKYSYGICPTYISSCPTCHRLIFQATLAFSVACDFGNHNKCGQPSIGPWGSTCSLYLFS